MSSMKKDFGGIINDDCTSVKDRYTGVKGQGLTRRRIQR